MNAEADEEVVTLSRESDEDDFENNNAKKLKINDGNGLDTTVGEDGEVCSICFDSWTSSGPHKLCCLRCGHLFGLSCIMKWLKAQGKSGRCPQCNAKATRNDIRLLYCRNLRVVDTTERDKALAQLETERTLFHKAEKEVAIYKTKCDLLQGELFQLQNEMQQLRKCLPHSVGYSSVPRKPASSFDTSNLQAAGSYDGQYEHIKSISISNTGNCRVMACCDYLHLLCVSQPSSNPIFRGFGVRKVNTLEQRPVKYVHLHQQPIRDLAFHPDTQDGVMLSVSLDKTIRLTSLLNDQIVQTYHCQLPVWSCCWAADSNRLFAGLSNGSVMLYDIRVTSGPLETIFNPENNAPVLGLQYLSEISTQNGGIISGLLVGQLTKVTFMTERTEGVTETDHASTTVDSSSTNNQSDGHESPELFNENHASDNVTGYSLAEHPMYKPHGLSLEGSLASISSVTSKNQFLVSYRPSQRLPRTRHVLAEIQSDDIDQNQLISCREIHSLWAGSRMKMLTRAKLFVSPVKETDLLAVGGSEDVNGAIVWRCDNGSIFQTIRPPDTNAEHPIIDVCPYSVSDSPQGYYLALLTERMLHLYVWNPS